MQEFERLMYAMIDVCDKEGSEGAPAAEMSTKEIVSKLWQQAEQTTSSDEPCISATTLSKVQACL